jgi:uncharacterized protein YndB with AHSA1/START domain
MELKTKINAEDGKQDLTITREFDLPVELLFQAHTEPELFEQWMTHEYGTTKVTILENKKHGSWRFETRDAQGKVVFGANGVFPEFVQNEKITRTFEMENSNFPVQLEFLEFERLTDETSRLNMHIVYRSVDYRDQLLKYGFAPGLSMAHDRLQKIVGKLHNHGSN